MYLLSRCLLQLAVILIAYSLIVLTLLGWPWLGIVLLGIGLAAFRTSRVLRLTTLGSARFADEGDLSKAGMLTAAKGFILGRVRTHPRPSRAMDLLFRRRTRAKEACDEFWDLFNRDRKRIVRLEQAIHISVYAPTGLGKGVSFIIPFLLDCGQSCVVIDFKGENATLTAKHRKEMFGHQVVFLDPFCVVAKTPGTFNPLEGIDRNDPLAIDACVALAKALVIRTHDEKDPHWNDSAELWIAAMLAIVVHYGEDGQRSLQTVREILSNPERIEMAIKVMRESEAWGGMLARMGGQLANYVDRERSSTLSTVSRHLRFLDTPAIAACTQKSSFDPDVLVTGKMTIFLILPPEQMRAQSSLLRMWIGSLLKSVVSRGLRTEDKVHFVLDEMATVGHLEVIEDAVDKFRGFGIRLQCYFQSLGQLKKCFPNGQDQTFLSNTTQIFFGVNDTATAELVSTRLGESTVIVDSGGTSDGSSRQNSMGAQPQQSSSYSFTTNRNWQQQARKILKPEEVIALSPRVAITFTPGVPPVCTTLLRYFEEPALGRRPGWLTKYFSACHTFAVSLILFAVSLGLALVVSAAASKAAHM